MAVKIWTIEEWLAASSDASEGNAGWANAAETLRQRAHGRGDGVAVYVNNDLGHRDLGQWQVVSYGSKQAQLETHINDRGVIVDAPQYFNHGDDVIPTTLPDIGGRINWRYTLEAIVPSYEQLVAAGVTCNCQGERLHGLGDPAVDCVFAAETRVDIDCGHCETVTDRCSDESDRNCAARVEA